MDYRAEECKSANVGLGLKTNQVNLWMEEFFFDDSTSCSSSLATSISDGDELYLGAEANSFEHNNNIGQNVNKNNVQNIAPGLRGPTSQLKQNGLLVMKDLCFPPEESGSQNCIVSAISSVKDIIDARECDPSRLLISLGFGKDTEDEKKFQILSRFSPASPGQTEDYTFDFGWSRSSRLSHNSASSSEYDNSISKTSQWLKFLQQSTTASAKADSSNNRPQNDTSRNLKVSSSNHPSHDAAPQPKGVNTGTFPRSLSKMRKRFSKSRQSSFEVVLPKLKEEDTLSEGDADESRPIDADLVKSALQTALTAADHSRVDTTTNDLTRDKEPICKSHDVQLLLKTQRESFELEEINSGKNSPSQCRRRRVGVTTIDERRDHLAAEDRESGFGEDDPQPADPHSEDDPTPDTQHVSLRCVVDSLESRCGFCPLRSYERTTLYVYDVDTATDASSDGFHEKLDQVEQTDEPNEQ